MNKWMIWGVFPLFLEGHPNVLLQMISPLISYFPFHTIEVIAWGVTWAASWGFPRLRGSCCRCCAKISIARYAPEVSGPVPRRWGRVLRHVYGEASEPTTTIHHCMDSRTFVSKSTVRLDAQLARSWLRDPHWLVDSLLFVCSFPFRFLPFLGLFSVVYAWQLFRSSTRQLFYGFRHRSVGSWVRA